MLFTAAAVLEDAETVVSMDAKREGDIVDVLGETRHELGGSEYLALKGMLGNSVPQVDTAMARALYEKLGGAIADGLVASCHDCSDGGLAAALAESAFAGGLGMQIDLGAIAFESPAATLFSESQSRFVVTVHADQAAAFEAALNGSPCYRIGETMSHPRLKIGSGGAGWIDAGLAELKEAWQAPLRW